MAGPDELHPTHELARTVPRPRLFRAAATAIGYLAATVTAYYLADWDQPTASRTGLRLASAIAVIGAATAASVVSIRRSSHPMLRAGETVIGVTVLAVVAFASIHLGLSTSDPGAFSEELGHTSALYFSVTTVTTVGFGDITPMSDLARIAVMVQMVANVAILGVAVRLIIRAARRTPQADDDAPGEAAPAH